MNERKYFICKHCGNFVTMIHDSGVNMVCCGEKMQRVTPNTVDASAEKHVPAISVSGSIAEIKIGEAAHPMAQEHYIEWIYIQTAKGGQCRCLKPGEEPAARFTLEGDDKLIAAYAYCNLHGLWMAKA